MTHCISVTVCNQSGQAMYIAVQHSTEDLWLSIKDPNELAWIPFNADTCVKEIETGTLGTPSTFDWNLTPYCSQQNQGVRMYVAETTFTDEILDPMTCPFIYDKVEMGWDAIWDITNVDFFSIPMQLEGNNQSVGFIDGLTRKDILHDLAKMPEPYKNLNAYSKEGTILRYLSPVQYINPDNSGQLNDCFQTAITNGLPLLGAYKGTFTYGDYTMSNFCVTAENNMTLDITTNSDSENTKATYTLSNINTIGVAGNNMIPSPSDAAGHTAAALIAAVIERGVLYNPSLWGQNGGANKGYPKGYYLDSSDNGNEYNQYAKVLHANSLCGLSYAFPFDDMFQQAATIQFNKGDHATITIMPFE